VQEEVQLREQDWGNFQEPAQQARNKEDRLQYGRFFYRWAPGAMHGCVCLWGVGGQGLACLALVALVSAHVHTRAPIHALLLSQLS
jgi:hypothetical protein